MHRHEQAGGLGSISGAALAELGADAALLTARRYHKLGELARGGSGRIITARDLVFDRTVAIKEPLDPARDGIRLRAEAEILARLQHPSIVPVYDTGVWSDGVPFFAMKLVDGRSLRDALHDAPRLEQRLAYLPQLRAVADALAYAHNRGVIHRDVKPGNVLVGRFGETIVIDWGLAKLSDAGGGPSAEPDEIQRMRAAIDTATGTVLGTPAYMAPEQAGGAVVDSRSDVYALGAILYHVLTGAAPFTGSKAEIIDAVIHHEPASIEALQPRAPADLAAIARKAMARDPAARYPTAAELADDLRRFETGRLVTARRYSPIARLRRWLRTRRAAVLAAVLATGAPAAVAVAVAVAALPDASLGAAAVCARSGDGILALWDPDHRFPDRSLAVRAAFRATGRASADDAFARVAAPLDRYARGWAAARVEACAATRVRGEQSDTLLDLRIACLDRRREDLDALLQAIADPQPSMIDRAILAAAALPPLAACDDARALQAVVPLPADPVARAAVEAVRRTLAKANSLLTTGRYSDGLSLATDAARRAEALGYAPLSAEALYLRSQLEARGGDARAAEATARAGLLAAGDGRADALAALGWTNLMFILGNDLQRPDDALALQTAAEAALHRAGSDPRTMATLWDAIGAALQNKGAPEPSRTYRERALAIRERVFGPDHLEVATTLLRLANTLNTLDRPTEAQTLLERALAIYQRTLGPEHPDVAKIENNLGNAYLQTGDAARALERYQRAIDITARALGPDHPDLGSRLNNRGIVLDGLGRYDEAVGSFVRAISVLERAYGPDHREAVGGRAKLGATYMHQGKLDDARRELERSVASFERTLGPMHIDLWFPLDSLGELALQRHDLAAAHRFLVRARAILLAPLGPAHPYIAAVDSDLADLALAEGRIADARSLAERSVQILAAHPTDLTFAESQFVLARVLWTAPADRPRAVAIARAARDAYEHAGAQRSRSAVEIAAWLDARNPPARR